jgi:hypothetical protein
MSNVLQTGWGFHISPQELAKAAFIWKYIRTFRLVRARQAGEIGAGNHVNLASLPNEIIDIIEIELATHAHDIVMTEEPFHFPCDDCLAIWDDFRYSSHFDDALRIFRSSYISESARNDEERSEESLNAFLTSEAYNNAFEAFMPIHQREIGCDQYEQAQSQFFSSIMSNLAPDPSDLESPLVRKLQLLNRRISP